MIKILLMFVAGLVILLLFLTIHILIKNRIQRAFIEESKAYTEKFYYKWHQHLVDDEKISRNMLPTKEAHYEAIEKIFLAYGKQYLAENTPQHIQQFTETKMKKYYEDQLSSKRWSTRLNALYRILDFKLFSIVPEFNEKHLLKVDSEERLQWLKVYAFIDENAVFHFVKNHHELFSELEHKQLFALLDEETLLKLCTHFDSLSDKAQIAFIDSLAVRQNNVFHDFFMKQLFSECLEVRIHTLKAFEILTIKPALEQLERSLSSYSWEERLMATRLLKYYEDEQVKEYLLKRSIDENEVVKKEAKKIAQDKMINPIS